MRASSHLLLTLRTPGAAGVVAIPTSWLRKLGLRGFGHRLKGTAYDRSESVPHILLRTLFSEKLVHRCLLVKL